MGKKILNDVITFRGNRELWIDFVTKIKKERKKVWDVLRVFIIQFLREK